MQYLNNGALYLILNIVNGKEYYAEDYANIKELYSILRYLAIEYKLDLENCLQCDIGDKRILIKDLIPQCKTLRQILLMNSATVIFNDKCKKIASEFLDEYLDNFKNDKLEKDEFEIQYSFNENITRLEEILSNSPKKRSKEVVIDGDLMYLNKNYDIAESILYLESINKIKVLNYLKSNHFKGNMLHGSNRLEFIVELSRDYLLNLNMVGGIQYTDNEFIRFIKKQNLRNIEWEDIGVEFIDGHYVKIDIKGRKYKTNYAKMGFEDKRTLQPNCPAPICSTTS